jgi:hypothetical protein
MHRFKFLSLPSTAYKWLGMQTLWPCEDHWWMW